MMTTGPEIFITLARSESELLLAESTYEHMKDTESHHLVHHSDLNCINCGCCGGLIAALLLMRVCNTV